MVVAHRGCWLMDGDEFYINENCPAGVEMAARYGYPAVEIDVRYTLDSVSTAIWLPSSAVLNGAKEGNKRMLLYLDSLKVILTFSSAILKKYDL